MTAQSPRTMQRLRRGARQGIALLMTVLVLAVLSVVIYAFAREVDLRARVANNREADVRHRYAAESALNYAVALLRKDCCEGRLDTLDDVWARDLAPVTIEGIRFHVRIADENAKLDINAALDKPKPSRPGADALERLILALGGGQGDLAALQRWVTRGAASGAREGKSGLRSVDELRLVDGLSPGLVQGSVSAAARVDAGDGEPLRFIDFVTVYTHGNVNINTASPEVLSAILGPAASQALSRRRFAPFRSTSAVRAFFKEEVHDEAAASVFRVASSYFSIRVEPMAPDPKMEGGEAAWRSLYAVVYRGTKHTWYRMRKWYYKGDGWMKGGG